MRTNLIPHSSQKVKPPGIEGCLAWMECILVEEISRKNYSLVIGKVVHLEVDDRFFNENGDMDFERAKHCPLCLATKVCGLPHPFMQADMLIMRKCSWIRKTKLLF